MLWLMKGKMRRNIAGRSGINLEFRNSYTEIADQMKHKQRASLRDTNLTSYNHKLRVTWNLLHCCIGNIETFTTFLFHSWSISNTQFWANGILLQFCLVIYFIGKQLRSTCFYNEYISYSWYWTSSHLFCSVYSFLYFDSVSNKFHFAFIFNLILLSHLFVATQLLHSISSFLYDI